MIKLTFTPVVVAPDDVAPASLLMAIRKLHAHVPIKELFVDLKDAATRKYLYRLTTAEATPRLFKQYLWITEVVEDVGMTFDVTDVWKMHEFVPHREVRDVVIAMLRSYPTLATIKYEDA